MTGPNEDLYAWVAAAALAAGVTQEELDEARQPPKCFVCKKPQVARLGCLCPKCEAEEKDRARAVDIGKAWATVPESMRWVDLVDKVVAKKMETWVKDHDALKAAGALVHDLPAHRIVTLTGDPGAGKTTLACALLRSWIRLGARKSAKWAEYDRSRTARFDTVMDLLADRSATRLGEDVPSIDRAEKAGVLVLDEVGRGRDPHQIIFGLVHKRLRDCMPTIFTTPHRTVEELAHACGDGGLARRVFDGATVIHVRKI